MIALVLLAQDVVIRPCEGIEPETWWWWIKGCWLLGNPEVVATVGVSLFTAGMTAAALSSLRQK